MGNAKWFFVFLIFSGAVFTANAQNRHIFIDGTAVRADQLTFFLDNFRMEAEASGYTVASGEDSAGYTFRFEVIPNIITYDDGTQEPAPPGEKQYIIVITFLNNAENTEMISYDFPFTNLDEMYEYNQYLFLKSAILIPPINESDIIAPGSGGWQNKWLYLRASFDFPITFYKLKSNGLIGGTGVYEGPFAAPNRVSPLDNQVVIALPAMTLGLELQFLDFMSAGINFQAGLEHLNDTNFVNMSAGLNLMFPLKFIRNITLEPYVGALYPIVISDSPVSFLASGDIFASFPRLAFGGGLQIGIKGAPAGSVFIDINYMYYWGDAERKNPYGSLYPEPKVIHYQRSVIGLGIGYKFGFIDRKSK